MGPGLMDQSFEVLHFMCGSKSNAPKMLCDGDLGDLTGGGLDGYGCKE